MSVVVETVQRLGPPVVTFALGRFTPRIVAEVKGRRAKRFWAPVATTPTEIILGRHVRPDWEPSGLLGLGDARALSELREHFRELYVREPTIVYDDQLRGRDLTRSSLIVIGGPFANAFVRDLWQKLSLSWELDASGPDRFAVIDHQSGSRLVPERDAHGRITADFGLAVRAPSPVGREPRYKLFAFCGCYGFGTLAAARFSTYPDFVNHELVADGAAVACLVKTTVSDGTPQHVEPIEFRPLQAGATARGQDTRG